MDNPNELEWLKNYKPSIDDLKMKSPDYIKMKGQSLSKLEADVLGLAIILKDLVVLLHTNPLSTKNTQEMVDNLNQIMDDITRNISKPKVYYCSVCHKVQVDAENGYDTCFDCASKI
jgi:hypothetical protein